MPNHKLAKHIDFTWYAEPTKQNQHWLPLRKCDVFCECICWVLVVLVKYVQLVKSTAVQQWENAVFQVFFCICLQSTNSGANVIKYKELGEFNFKTFGSYQLEKSWNICLYLDMMKSMEGKHDYEVQQTCLSNNFLKMSEQVSLSSLLLFLLFQ